MKKIFLLLVITGNYIFSPIYSFSQVAINITGTTPDASAMLDVQSTTKGLLVPKLTSAQRAAITSPATGLLVYQTDGVPGFYFNSGTPLVPAWIILTTSLNGWSTAGNSGTNPSTHFLGTADNQPLQLKLNNVFAGKFDHINRNYLLGLNAGSSITTGKGIVAIGNAALRNNTTALDNVAMGDSVLTNSNGNFNTAMGSKAMYANSTGASNTSVGYHAMLSNTTGSSNTAIGLESLRLNSIGFNNTAIGYQSMYANTSGDENTALGNYSLFSNISSNFNVALGVYAMNDNTTGNSNTAVGYRSLLSNTTGIANSALGLRSMYSNVSGNYNIAIGYYSMYSNTTGDYNVAIGRRALYSNTTDGFGLVAIGDSALYSNINWGNTAIGYKAMLSNHVGFKNTAIGYESLYKNTFGDANTAMGFQTLNANTTGAGNTAVGAFSLYSNTNAVANTAIGDVAMYGNTDGDRNTAVGVAAGNIESSNSNCTFLGYDADNNVSAPYSNSMALGSSSRISANNQVRIGDISITSIGGYVNWSNISDRRFKKNVQENVPGLNFILQLNPVTYNLDIAGLNAWLHQKDLLNGAAKSGIQQKEGMVQTGFVAQDVEAAARKLGYQFSGVDAPKNNEDVYSLRYAEFVVPLVKAVQEQQKIINSLQMQVEAGKTEIPMQIGKQQKMIETLQNQNAELRQELILIKKKLGL